MALAGTNQPVVSPVTGGRDTQAADSGNYFVAITPTPGTGIISGNPTTFAETTPMLVLYNPGPNTVYPMYLRLASTVVGGGAATKNFTHVVDTGNRYSSGGTALVVKNTNVGSSTASSVIATTGAVTATAATGKRAILGNDWPRVSVADIVGDIYEWTFGGTPGVDQQIATAMHFVKAAPAVALPPNSSYLMYVWSGTFTQGITFEVQLGFVEK
jgi:hypothetical protein